MKRYGFFVIASIVGAGFGHANAAEHDAHAGHSMTAPATAPGTMPSSTPASGKAREAGYEGMDMMEATGVEVSLAVQCAQAGRGIVMLDRATLARCAGQAAPAPPVVAPAEHHQH